MHVIYAPEKGVKSLVRHNVTENIITYKRSLPPSEAVVLIILVVGVHFLLSVKLSAAVISLLQEHRQLQ